MFPSWLFSGLVVALCKQPSMCWSDRPMVGRQKALRRFALVWFSQPACNLFHFSEGLNGSKLYFSDSHSGLCIETIGESKKYMSVLLAWAASWALEILKFPWWFQKLRTFNESWGLVITATQCEKRRHLGWEGFSRASSPILLCKQVAWGSCQV